MTTIFRAALAALLLLLAPAFGGARAWAADLQTNINFLSYGGEFPFLNHVTTGAGWSFLSPFSAVPPNNYTTDNRGYSQVSASGPAAGINCAIPTQAERPGQYVLVWSGADTNATTGTHIGVAYGPTPGTNEVAEFVPTSSSGTLPFTPTYSNGNSVWPALRGNVPAGFKLAVVHANDLTAYQNGEIVGRQYRDRIKAAGINGLRWMTVTSTNTNQIVDAADLMPADSASLVNPYFRPALWSGTSTTSVRVVKVTPYAGFSLTDGAKIMFKLDADLTGAAPYNTSSNQMVVSFDGGTTLVPVRGNNSGQLWTGLSYPAGSFVYAVYDALFGALVVINTAGGPEGGIHPDLIAQYHRELSAYVGWPVYIYHNVPGLAVDRKNQDGSNRDVTDWISYTVGRFNVGLASTPALYPVHYEMG